MAAVESRRLSFVRSHDDTAGERELPLTIFVLLTNVQLRHPLLAIVA